jgi:hypothetical protein
VAAATPVQRKKLRRLIRFIEHSHPINRENIPVFDHNCVPYRLDTAMRRRLADAHPLRPNRSLTSKKIPGLLEPGISLCEGIQISCTKV